MFEEIPKNCRYAYARVSSKSQEDARDLKLIELRFTLLMKTNKTLEVEKLTSNLLVKAKSIFYTEIP